MKRSLLFSYPMLFLSFSVLLLARGQVIAQTVEAGDGFGVTVSTDQPVYSTRTSPFEPPSITMNLLVFNRSDQNAEMEFASGQRFDFEIHNSAGELIWRWSDGKFFIQILELLTLAPGEELSFSASHVFAGEGGSPLPEGTYTVTGKLASPSTIIEGKTSFLHRHF